MTLVFKTSFFLVVCLYSGLYLFYHDKNILAKVDFSTSGCFYSEKSNLVLYKKDSFIIADLIKSGKQRQSVKLNKLQIDSFYSFVQALKKIKEKNGCTTVSEYILKFDNETIKKTDGGCHWDGFRNLKLFLFESKSKIKETS